MAVFSADEYAAEKRNYILRCASGDFPGVSQLEMLRAYGGELAEGDFDLAILELDIKTKHFKKLTSKSKASKMLLGLRHCEPDQKSEYARTAIRTMGDYVTMCESRAKHRKIALTLCLVIVLLLLGVGIAGLWYADNSGLLYGVGAVSFTADGQTYSQTAVRYNDYVSLRLPEKAAYDIVGVRDRNSGGMLFDNEGVSKEKVGQRDLSDYADCDLEVVYEPHVYTASIRTATGVSATDFTFTVEDSPEDTLDDPPHLDGYVFVGWFTDAHYKKPFSGDFGDYIDEPLALYPKYALDSWSISWDLQGGYMLGGELDHYTVLTDVALPKGDIVKRRGYDLVGWTLNGKLIEYFPSTDMQDVTLVAVWEPQVYTITICPDNGETACTQTVTYDSFYCLSVPSFKGFTLTGLTVGEEEFKTAGIYGFDTDITVVAHYKALEYTISYVSGSDTIYRQTVSYGQPYRLYVPDSKENYEFTGWFDDMAGAGKKAADGVYNSDFNIVLYASWKKVLTIKLESGKEYTVDKTIDKVYVVGNYKGSSYSLMTDICISVSPRDTDLEMQLIDVGFRAKENRAAIGCENSSYTLTILLTGDSYIEGGKGSDGTDGESGSAMNASNCNGSNGQNGGCALNCGTVIFENAVKNSSLTLKGGSGGKGGNGGVDEDRRRMWLRYVPDAGNGGNSASALSCVSYSINGTTVNLEKGVAGEGGKAGSRGDWWCAACFGSDGVAGKQSDAVNRK